MDIVKGIDVDDEEVIDTTNYDENKREVLKFAINDYINERLNAISREKQ